MNIIPFAFDSLTVRTIMREGEPWFHAADVCAALDIANAPQAAASLGDRHKHMQGIGLPGKAPTFISEAGLYKIIMRSNKPEAERFQDWIADEVLPSIRKSGGYGLTPQHQQALDALRRVHEVADAEAERATRHDFYKIGSARAEANIQASVSAVAARHGLDATAVRLGLSTNVQQVMADVYGDPYAIRCLERDRLRIEAEVSRRIAATRTTAKRRSARR